MTQQWEVVDSYGIPQFTGNLNACGVWIDPIMGIVFPGTPNPDWPNLDDVDADRLTKNDDGSWTVEMYENMGTLTVRKVVNDLSA